MISVKLPYFTTKSSNKKPSSVEVQTRVLERNYLYFLVLFFLAVFLVAFLAVFFLAAILFFKFYFSKD